MMLSPLRNRYHKLYFIRWERRAQSAASNTDAPDDLQRKKQIINSCLDEFHRTILHPIALEHLHAREYRMEGETKLLSD